MTLRSLRVGYRPADSRSRVAASSWSLPAPMPFVRLAGRWLERAGFAIGTAVRVQVEPGRLVLEVIAPEEASKPRARRAAGD